MIARVLVPMDDSEMADHALEYALEAHPDAEITVLHVVGGPSPMMGKAMGLALEDDLEEAAEEHAAQVFERAREIAGTHETEIRTDVAWGTPAKVIVNRATDFDTVVLGSHGGTLAERLFVGDVAQKVFRHSPVPVTVVR
ncbi:universal stress protein [Haloarchaeobius iranensis]|uniref:Nucleotide-binding universal stress protein, UspA family n=1 Tax=Haloarchaeobius iranensis TaxID=996166 RepID=A0A1G9UK45_9EURY|nr:universal stress protein [Haloarchaeobius iranensis]SDM60268.1 Nucleotide-binding universal stress protein, UspA family [Haloarchaeobius iranensis]